VLTYSTRPAESLGQAVLPVAMGSEGFIQSPAAKETNSFHLDESWSRLL